MSVTVSAFSLPNVAAGADPFSLADAAAEHDAVVLFFQRDYHCTNCRKQVQSVRDRFAAFEKRGALPVSIVPEPPSRLADWQADYDLPYPLLADEDASVGDAYGQPVRFGILGSLSDFLGRMPEIVVLDTRGEEPRVAWTHRGSSTFDRPDVDEVLAAVDAALAEDATAGE